MNSDITTLSVNTSSFAQLETWYSGSPLVGTLQSSIKIVYFSDVEKAKCVLQFKQNHSMTLVQQFFHTIMVKKHLQEILFTSSTNHLLKMVAFCAKKKK
jgi:hypothetical protein